jgi:hypothetical protein
MYAHYNTRTHMNVISEIFDDKLNIDQIDELVVGLILFNLVG